MHPTGTITHGGLYLFRGRAPQRIISTRCTPMVCTASFLCCVYIGKSDRAFSILLIPRPGRGKEKGYMLYSCHSPAALSD